MATRCVNTAYIPYAILTASMKNVIRLLVVLGIVGGGAAYHVTHKPVANPATSLRTAAIQRGDLLSTISATGTVEPKRWSTWAHRSPD